MQSPWLVYAECKFYFCLYVVRGCCVGIRMTDIIYVGGSSKIQTLCHMARSVLKLRFTAMKRLTGY